MSKARLIEEAVRLEGVAQRIRELAAVWPAPTFPGEPVPDPDPLPSPPDGAIFFRALNLASVLHDAGWSERGRYKRHQTVQWVNPSAEANQYILDMFVTNYLAGGRAMRPQQPVIVRWAGQEMLIEDPSQWTHPIDVAHLRGWVRIDLESTDPQVTGVPVWVMVSPPGEGHSQTMPVFDGSYTVTRGASTGYREAMVPAVRAPVSVPLTPRTFRSAPIVMDPNQYAMRQLQPVREGDLLDPCRDMGSGAICTANIQAYHDSRLEKPRPHLPLYDGERGESCYGGITWLRTGHNGLTWGCTAWSVFVITATGRGMTLAGYRHSSIRPHWAHRDRPEAEPELVGDWSAVDGPHSIQGCWGAAWNTDTTAVTADRTHVGEHVILYVTDPHHGRVLEMRFDASDQTLTVPPVISVLAEGLREPWAVAYWGGHAYISERMGDVIVRVDVKTKELEPWLMADGQYSTGLIGWAKLPTPNLDIARAQPVVAPEGLDVYEDLSGEPWLYYASLAIGEVRRAHLVTREWETRALLDEGNNANFCQLAVATDGTFLPRGSMLCSTWGAGDFGMPSIYLPDGVKVRITRHTSRLPAAGVGRYGTIGYSSACAVGRGRMLAAGSQIGLVEVSAAQESDPRIDPEKYREGRRKWRARGLDLTHGEHGWGYYGLPMPDDLTPEEAYYVEIGRV